MKLISCLIRPDKVDSVKRELARVNVFSLTILEARDHSPQRYETTVWMGQVYCLGSSRKMSIQVVVHDDDADEVIGVIMRTARTGAAGDGHVCVMSVDHRYNITTGHRDVQ